MISIRPTFSCVINRKTCTSKCIQQPLKGRDQLADLRYVVPLMLAKASWGANYIRALSVTFSFVQMEGIRTVSLHINQHQRSRLRSQ